MGLTKSEIFTAEQNELAALAKVLGHPARISILEHLLQIVKCICGDLVLEIGLAQPTISQHLKELKNAGLIKGNIEGNSVCYCIDANNWKEARDLINDFFSRINNTKSNCC